MKRTLLTLFASGLIFLQSNLHTEVTRKPLFEELIGAVQKGDDNEANTLMSMGTDVHPGLNSARDEGDEWIGVFKQNLIFHTVTVGAIAVGIMWLALRRTDTHARMPLLAGRPSHCRATVRLLEMIKDRL